MSNSLEFVELKAYLQVVQRSLQRLALDDRTPQALYSPIQYTLTQKGAKRIRPVLVFLVQEFLHPKEPLIPSPAVALEIFHNFTLLHDDVMDNSSMRRGDPSVFAKYGLSSAILSGDAMLILAYRMLMDDTSLKVLPELLRAFNHMATHIMEGQQLDLEYEKLDYISEEQYLQMVGYKTAELIATSTLFGAILAQVDIAQKKLCYQFGWNLGIAFQLQDDYLDLYGDSDTFGKPLGGDILEGKKTILHTLAYAHASLLQQQKLADSIGMSNEFAEKKITTVKALYDEIGVPSQAKALVNTYLEQAQKDLNTLERTYGREAVQLRAFIDKLAKRNT